MSCESPLPSENKKPSLATLRGALTDLPYATYQDFLDIKAIWNPRIPEGESTEDCNHSE